MDADLKGVFFNLNEFAYNAKYFSETRGQKDIIIQYRAGGELLDPDTQSIIISHEPRALMIKNDLLTDEPGPNDKLEIYLPDKPAKMFYIDRFEDHRQGTIILFLAEQEP